MRKIVFIQVNQTYEETGINVLLSYRNDKLLKNNINDNYYNNDNNSNNNNNNNNDNDKNNAIDNSYNFCLRFTLMLVCEQINLWSSHQRKMTIIINNNTGCYPNKRRKLE